MPYKKKPLDVCLQEYMQYSTLLVRQYIDAAPFATHCPHPDCGCSILLKPLEPEAIKQVSEAELAASAHAAIASGRALDISCACGQEFCWHCKQAAHEPAQCHHVSLGVPVGVPVKEVSR
jgi:hypothetical protein